MRDSIREGRKDVRRLRTPPKRPGVWVRLDGFMQPMFIMDIGSKQLK